MTNNAQSPGGRKLLWTILFLTILSLGLGRAQKERSNSSSTGAAVKTNDKNPPKKAIIESLSPRNVPQLARSLRLWLRADAGVVSKSGRVIRWLDQSGNHNDVSQSEVAGQPLLVPTGNGSAKPAVRFGEAGESLKNLATTGLRSNSMTIIAVFSRHAAVLRPGKITSYSYADTWDKPSEDSWELAIGTNGMPYSEFAQAATTATGAGTTTAIPVDTLTEIEGVYSQDTGQRFYVNSALAGSNTIKGPVVSGNRSVLEVGNDVSSRDGLNGDVQEVLVFNADLTDPQRRLVEAYLHEKYGIGETPTALPSFGIPPGTYDTAQTVRLMPGKVGDTVYYSLDGTTPNLHSPAVTTATLIGFKTTTTIKAVEVGEIGFAPSTISATYTIDPKASFLDLIRPALWLRADVGTGADIDGARVSQWLDQSGRGYDVRQTVKSAQPLWETKGKGSVQPALRFNGITQYLGSSEGLKPASITMMAVYSVAGPTNYPEIIAQNFNARGWTSPYVSWALVAGEKDSLAPYSVVTQANNGNIASTPVNTVLSKLYLLEGIYDEAGKHQVFLNGGSAIATNKVSGPIGYGTGGLFEVGSDGNNELFKGEVSEILVFDTALSCVQRAAIESYLVQRYGIVY